MKRKRANLFFMTVLLTAGFFGFDSPALASGDNLIISEIMYDPTGADPKHEWLEIYNSGSESINLEDWKFFEAGANHGLALYQGSFVLGSKKYAIVTADATTFKNDYPDFSGTLIDSVFSLSNSGESLAFKNKAGELAADFSYSSGCGGNGNGFSLEYDTAGNCQESYVPGGTPGEKNSEKPDPKEYSQDIFISELFPNPPDEDDEYIELGNLAEETVNLDGWILRDSSKTGKYVLPEDSKIDSGEFLAIYKKDYKFSLNNSGLETVFFYDPGEKLVDEVSYSGSKENKSYSFDGEKWRWSQYLTPGEDNLFNNLPVVSSKKENKIYVGVYAQFSAKAGDKDGEKLKFTWDFGDGHKGYKQNARHKYEKTGNYTATLKVTDSNEDVLETFDIKVINFPKIKLRIKEIVPNPKGLDTKESGEYIVIKNESGKKINLKGWGVATGSKKLYNHPITKDFVLKPGQSKKITRKYSKFSLANQKSKIELRYPNGKVAYKIKYSKEKIAEDEIYKKVDGKWKWSAPPSETTALNNSLPAAQQINNAPAENPTPEEVSANLGKYSENPEWQKKKETTVVLASFNVNLHTPKPQGRVLGASTVREDETYYAFTPPTPPEKHWAVNALEKLLSPINSIINQLLLLFNK